MNARRMLSAAALAVLLIGETLHARSAAYRYETLDYPGSTETKAAALNDAAELVGTTTTGGVTHSFLWRNGSYLNIDRPGSFFTQARGINNLGQVVGNHLFSSPPGTAVQSGNFVRDRNGEYSEFDLSGFGRAGLPPNGKGILTRINDGGSKLGGFDFYRLGFGSGSFLWLPTSGTNGAFTVVGGAEWQAADISGSGHIAGTLTSAGRQQGFIMPPSLDDRDVVTFTYPGADNTSINGINDAGDVVGVFERKDHTRGSFIRTARGEFVQLDLPGQPTDINAAREISGWFTDGSGRIHGFLAVPSIPETDRWVMLGVGFTLVALWRRHARGRMQSCEPFAIR